MVPLAGLAVLALPPPHEVAARWDAWTQGQLLTVETLGSQRLPLRRCGLQLRLLLLRLLRFRLQLQLHLRHSLGLRLHLRQRRGLRFRDCLRLRHSLRLQHQRLLGLRHGLRLRLCLVLRVGLKCLRDLLLRLVREQRGSAWRFLERLGAGGVLHLPGDSRGQSLAPGLGVLRQLRRLEAPRLHLLPQDGFLRLVPRGLHEAAFGQLQSIDLLLDVLALALERGNRQRELRCPAALPSLVEHLEDLRPVLLIGLSREPPGVRRCHSRHQGFGGLHPSQGKQLCSLRGCARQREMHRARGLRCVRSEPGQWFRSLRPRPQLRACSLKPRLDQRRPSERCTVSQWPQRLGEGLGHRSLGPQLE
mmetsp:Transcript_53295/g.170753  ORF Transcript_53295/g.170753 Transcript_53295/m.170753 type:complete len:361 (-) Transcript_53295:329-1411(-)